MKTRIITLLLLGSFVAPAFADDLMSLGKEEKDTTGNTYSPFTVTNIDEYLKKLPYPESQNPEDYVNYFAKYVDKSRQNVIALVAQKNPQVVRYERTAWGLIPKVDVARCLSHPQAYEIKPISGNEHELTCLAGIGKKATHILRYRITVSENPTDCAKPAKIREYFTVAGNRNKVAAENFEREMRTGARCLYSGFPTNPGSPVVESKKIEQSALDKYLAREDKVELKEYIVGTSKKTKTKEKAADRELDNPFGEGLGSSGK